jgi:hypothetical protein
MKKLLMIGLMIGLFGCTPDDIEDDVKGYEYVIEVYRYDFWYKGCVPAPGLLKFPSNHLYIENDRVTCPVGTHFVYQSDISSTLVETKKVFIKGDFLWDAVRKYRYTSDQSEKNKHTGFTISYISYHAGPIPIRI